MPPTPEEDARQQIDAQLSAAGWHVASANAKLKVARDTPLALCEVTGDTARADIKPLEKRRRFERALDGVNATRRAGRQAEPANQCLIFLRDVRSGLIDTQMKGRGCCTIRSSDLAAVTPDAPGGHKTHFVLIDAVGRSKINRVGSTAQQGRLLQNANHPGSSRVLPPKLLLLN